MSLTALMGRPCQIIRRSPSGSYDRYGNEIAGEEVIETTCELQQAAREEEAGGSIAEAFWRGFFPVDTDLQAEDAIEIDGFAYEVIGDPWRADSGSTASLFSPAESTSTLG